MKKQHIWAVLILVILVVAVGAAIAIMPNQARDSAAARSLVEEFGGQLQHVSLLSPEDTLKSDIQSAYAPYVTSDLMQMWLTDPRHAPGRETSSPWPDRIEISSIAQQGSGYVATGNIVMKTSEGDADSQPVVIQVLRENGAWKIAAFQIGQSARSAD